MSRSLLWTLVRRHRWLAAVGAACGIGAAMEIAARPLLVQAAVNNAISGEQVAALIAVAILAGAAVVGAALEWVRVLGVGLFAERALADLRLGLARRLLAQTSAQHRDSAAMSLGAATNDTGAVAFHASRGIPTLVGAALTLLLTSGTLIVVQPVLGVIVLIGVAAVFAAVTRTYRRLARPAVRVYHDAYGEMAASFAETAGGAAVGWRFGRPDLAGRFERPNVDEGAAFSRYMELGARYVPTTSALRGATVALTLLLVPVVVEPAERLGVLAALVAVFPALFAAIGQLALLVDTITNLRSALARLGALDLDLDDAAPVTARATGGTSRSAPPSLATRGLVRRLGGFTLGPVDLHLTQGVTAVVGHSGAGKSTLLRLLAGLDVPDHGEVVHDGTSAGGELFRPVLLPQEHTLFPGTIRDNLLLAAPATPDKELISVIERLHAGPWLARLPHSLDTPAADLASAGERQLVALAQVLLADPAIVLLDEPTTALDPATAVLVDKAAAEAFQGRVVVVVTHRMTSAQAADAVALMADGAIVASGHHDELVRTHAAYRRLWAV